MLSPETEYDILETNIPMVRSFHVALEEYARICGSPILTWDQLAEINFNGIEKKTGFTFQHKLSERQRPSLYNNFIAQVTDTKLLAWLTSLKNEDSKSAKWLQMVPKDHNFKFTSKEFQISLCYRLFLQQPCYIPNSKCFCKKNSVLDSRGHHIANGCQKLAALTKTHDNIKVVLRDLCNAAGLQTRVEETGVFQEAVPDSNRRPDLSIFNHPNPKYYPNKVIMDVSLAHPIPIDSNRVLTRNQALAPGRAANAAHSRKINSYSVISEQAGLKFLPLIFETTGRMHEETESAIKEIIDLYCEDKPPSAHNAIQHYWFGRLSCVLQRTIANSIFDKSRIINGRLTKQCNLRASEDFLANLPYILANTTL